MKKFYKTAEVGIASGGYVICLDGKNIKTPLQKPLLVESKALAEALAIEWDNQKSKIDINSMPLNQFANTMVDKANGTDRAEMNKELLRYVSSDLLCYFATEPQILVKKHEEHWSPLIEWFNNRYNIALEVVSGINYHNQPEESLKTIANLIEALNPREFTIVQTITGITGSVVIGLAMLEGRASPIQAYEAACVDEIYQLEAWGEDADARERLDKIKIELENIRKFIDLSVI